MLLMLIIVSILYLIMIYAVLSLYYKYRKDIEEIENRCLQLEKRLIDNSKNLQRQIIEIQDLYVKEVDNMACGTKGRPRGRRTTSRGGGRGK